MPRLIPDDTRDFLVCHAQELARDARTSASTMYPAIRAGREIDGPRGATVALVGATIYEAADIFFSNERGIARSERVDACIQNRVAAREEYRNSVSYLFDNMRNTRIPPAPYSDPIPPCQRAPMHDFSRPMSIDHTFSVGPGPRRNTECAIL